jgi:acyl-CoA reductase-like NAD-dependent aldehyde dehydrogenase
MMERKEDLARLMTREQGKPLKAARNEVQYGADFLLVVRRGGQAGLRGDDSGPAARPAFYRAS